MHTIETVRTMATRVGIIDSLSPREIATMAEACPNPNRAIERVVTFALFNSKQLEAPAYKFDIEGSDIRTVAQIVSQTHQLYNMLASNDEGLEKTIFVAAGQIRKEPFRIAWQYKDLILELCKRVLGLRAATEARIAARHDFAN